MARHHQSAALKHWQAALLLFDRADTRTLVLTNCQMASLLLAQPPLQADWSRAFLAQLDAMRRACQLDGEWPPHDVMGGENDEVIALVCSYAKLRMKELMDARGAQPDAHVAALKALYRRALAAKTEREARTLLDALVDPKGPFR